jgi:hypothetical protein
MFTEAPSPATWASSDRQRVVVVYKAAGEQGEKKAKHAQRY